MSLNDAPGVPAADGVAEVLQSLAHPTRLRAILLLAQGGRTVKELAAELGLPANLVVHHLGALHRAGLVTSRPGEPDRRSRWYVLERGGLDALLGLLGALAGARQADEADGSSAPLDRLLASMSRTGDGFFVVDRDGRIVQWNAVAEALVGQRARDVVGRLCHDVLRGRAPGGQEVCQASCRPMQLLAAGAPPASFPLAVADRAGSGRAISVSLVPLPDGLVAHVVRDDERRGELESFAVRVRQALGELLGARRAAADPPDARAEPAVQLTAREREVLTLLAAGGDTRAIAARLVVSPSTARKHIQSLLTKLGAHSRLEAVAAATRAGLLS